MTDHDLRALERRLAASNDPADARALARARFRLNGDCGVELRVPWSRRCGNESQVALSPDRVGAPVRVLPPCPSCAARILRDKAVALATTADQRNWVRGFKTWSLERLDGVELTVQSRARLKFMGVVDRKSLGYSWSEDRHFGGEVSFRPGRPPEESLAACLGDDDESWVYAYYVPKITNENREAKKQERLA